MEDNQNNKFMPAAIVIAGILIAGAVIYTDDGVRTVTDNDEAASELNNVRPVSEDDHIKGNPDAEVFIVEYSDFECPFCKRFHDTMNQIMSEIGNDGEVAWVYRHFPLDSLHPRNARKVAVASECAAEVGGNDAFWGFSDRFVELTPSNDRTDLEVVIPQIANEIGVAGDQFDECLVSGRYDAHIQEDVDNAIATGGRGTPWSVVLTKSGKTFPLSGAQPQASVMQLINFALNEE